MYTQHINITSTYWVLGGDNGEEDGKVTFFLVPSIFKIMKRCGKVERKKEDIYITYIRMN